MNQGKQPKRLKVDRALLVGVEIFNDQKVLSLENSLTELRRLADTAGFEVVGQVTQKLDHPNSKTFIGSGKVKEVKSIADELLADVILFDEVNNPSIQIKGIMNDMTACQKRTKTPVSIKEILNSFICVSLQGGDQMTLVI